VKQIMQHDFVGSSPVAGHYHAKSLGTPFKVYLANGFEINADPLSGKETLAITDLSGLIATVVRTRVLHDRKLSGDDLKFIRSALRVKSKDIAELIDMTPENYSRCESGLRTMSITTEKVYRANVFLMSVLNDMTVRDALSNRPPAPDKEVSAKKAQKAYEAFQKIFLKMKISPFCEAGEDLVFVFSRGPRPNRDTPRGNEDSEWQNEQPERKVA
jgi:hypothetical protein